MVRAGFDALILDMQHGMTVGPDRAGVWLQIVGQSETTPIVRVPWNEPFFMQWVLDAGAMGVIIPMVNSVEDARKAIGACKYPPIGYRSLGPNRAAYQHGADYFTQANSEVICLPQIETIEGVNATDEIAKLPGIDGFFVGPSDLAVSMNLPPMMDHKDPKHVAAVDHIVEVAKRNKLALSIFMTGPEEAARRWKQGFNLNPMGSEAFLLNGAVRRLLTDLRKALGS
jgi:4-hydroxy-2-oxoheptanedioate aldolase